MIHIYVEIEDKLQTVTLVKKDKEVLASFNSETGRVDLSVLKPYVGQQVTFHKTTIETDLAYIHRIEEDIEGKSKNKVYFGANPPPFDFEEFVDFVSKGGDCNE